MVLEGRSNTAPFAIPLPRDTHFSAADVNAEVYQRLVAPIATRALPHCPHLQAATRSFKSPVGHTDEQLHTAPSVLPLVENQGIGEFSSTVGGAARHLWLIRLIEVAPGRVCTTLIVCCALVFVRPPDSAALPD